MTIPFNFSPRLYQLPLLDAMDSGYKRAVCIWHRRAGKDKTLINLMVKKMLERVGTYFYLFPTYSQGRKILWEGRDKDGFKFLDHLPSQIIKNVNATEMKIELFNGSILRIIGTDNIDSIVGTNPVGCIFSEYSLQDPLAWMYLRPILAENDGWAVFNYTPRGHNHGFDLYEMARVDNTWFTQLLTVDDTHAISKEVLEQERKEIMISEGEDAIFRQEYYCSFDAKTKGAIFSDLLSQARTENRIRFIPYEAGNPVDVFFDLGRRDMTSIWFKQSVMNEHRFIRSYQFYGKDIDFYLQYITQQGYLLGDCYLPHDATFKRLETNDTIEDIVNNSKLFRDVHVVDRIPKKALAISAARRMLPQCFFDTENCKEGLNALDTYHYAFNEKTKLYSDEPEHDLSSHYADSFMTFAQYYKPPITNRMQSYTSHAYESDY